MVSSQMYMNLILPKGSLNAYKPTFGKLLTKSTTCGVSNES